MQGRGSALPLDPGEMPTASLNSTHLWPAKRSQTLKMKHLLPQFPSILAIYCFCMLQIPSPGKEIAITSACPEFYGRLRDLYPSGSFSTELSFLPSPTLTSTLLFSGVALVSNRNDGHSETPQPFAQRLSPEILGLNSPCPRSVLTLWWWNRRVWCELGENPA